MTPRAMTERDRRFFDELERCALKNPGPLCPGCDSTCTVSLNRLGDVWICIVCDGTDFVKRGYEGGVRRDEADRVWRRLD